ncbi:MAG TPA: fatty acid desaturase [Polyangiaceae bacterium]|nr:fatty acid desaturase [Polyangiaceae bacterium]
MSYAEADDAQRAEREPSRRRTKVGLSAVKGGSDPRADLKQMELADGRLHLLYGLPYLLSYFGCAAVILLTHSLALKIATGILMGNQLYLLFILHHDCVHFSACRSRRWNVFLGRIYALFLVKTFTATLETHKRHHAFLGEPGKDPDDHFFAGGIRWVWMRYWQNFSWHTYLSLTQYGPKVKKTVLLEQAANVGFWVGVHLLLYHFGVLRDALFVFWLPAVTIILLVGPVTRSYEHLPLAHYVPTDPRRFDIAYNTVTVTSRLLGLFWANITYHVEHHSYSRIPFYRLHRAHALLKAHGDTSYLVAPYTLYGVFQGETVVEDMGARGRLVRQGDSDAADLKSATL